MHRPLWRFSMLLSVNWLKEFVPYEGTVEELGHRLTMMGLEVEEIIYPFSGLEGVVVGHVLTCEKHPEADKLSLCTVDVADEEPLAIVCGAPNVAAGQKVAVAKIGAQLPNGLKIKKSKIRGQKSFGMICAEDELGLSEDHSGIMVLDEALTPGTRLAEALNLDEVVMDIGVTPNRADCFSVLGLAREVGIAFNLPVSMPEFTITETGPDAKDMVRIELPEPELCALYSSRVLEGIEVKPSPAWMRYRLLAVGQRPINNIVDITNYVMFELGQPMHAFDMDLLDGDVVSVASAKDGQKFVTLDEQERELNANDMVIMDGEKAVGLAGVMGGANSEIHTKSTRVFLESAVFTPAKVRRTARKLALPSEASFRFERGVDHPGSVYAMNRAAVLMAELSGGELRPGAPHAESRPWTSNTISFRPERAVQLLGVPLDNDFCEKTVAAMGCTLENTDTDTWTIRTPSHRLDLEREADIIEELGRVYGLDRIPSVLPAVGRDLSDEHGKGEYFTNMRIKHWAMGAGLREAVNYSFVGDKDLDILNLPQENRIPVMNPLSDEQNVLRTMLGPGLMNTLRQNLAQGNDRLRIFELAHVFHADPESATTATEPVRLGLMLYGNRFEGDWPWPDDSADYQDLKGLVEHLTMFLGLPAPAYELMEEHPWLSPCVKATLKGRDLGVLGCVKPEIAEKQHAKKEAWVAELDVDLLVELSDGYVVEFENLPKYPPSRRDMTVIAPPTLPVGDITDVFKNSKSSLLEDVGLIDVYTPENAEKEEKPDRHLTFRFTYRHGKKTLKDKDVDKEMEKMAKLVTTSLPVRL